MYSNEHFPVLFPLKSTSESPPSITNLAPSLFRLALPPETQTSSTLWYLWPWKVGKNLLKADSASMEGRWVLAFHFCLTLSCLCIRMDTPFSYLYISLPIGPMLSKRRGDIGFIHKRTVHTACFSFVECVDIRDGNSEWI